MGPTYMRSRNWREAVEEALNRRDAAERYQLRQQEVRRASAAAERPRPLEFDESGFPIAQPVPSFMRRLGRLLGS
jgi:hypothetical protein